MTDRELLKEARELIVAMVDWNKAMLKIVGHVPDTGFQSAEGLLSHIDEHLADHSPDAGNMVAAEIVRKIRNRSPQNICEKCGGTWEMHDETLKCNGRLSNWKARFDYDLSETEAAAMIEQYAKRVPRAMLEKIEKQAFEYCKEPFLSYETLDAIATKYGVKIEEDGK